MSTISGEDPFEVKIVIFHSHLPLSQTISNFLEALELLRNPQAEGGVAQAIVDAIFSRKNSDIVEFTYDTDSAVKANSIGTDKRSPTPSEGLMRGKNCLILFVAEITFDLTVGSLVFESYSNP